MPYQILTRDEHFGGDGSPKRILALDGGGLRGILSLGILEKVEDLLRERHGGADGFRLCHYFDLIAGTSTGAIIAAALAQGRSVGEVRDRYFSLGRRVFERSLLRQVLLRARYDERALVSELKDLFGVDTTLGGPELLTGLLVVIKRLDSGSPWPVSNNPRGRYFVAGANGRMGNRDYPLWQVVRASTAAPSYFRTGNDHHHWRTQCEPRDREFRRRWCQSLQQPCPAGAYVRLVGRLPCGLGDRCR